MVSASTSNTEFVDTTNCANATNASGLHKQREEVLAWLQETHKKFQQLKFHEQTLVLTHDRTPIILIAVLWPDLEAMQRDIVTRRGDLPPHFIWKHWDELTGRQKRYCFLHQDPLDGMPIEQLSQFIVNPISVVRAAAIERYEQVRGQDT